ncbi:MAG: hypothetical protein Q8Q42_03885 [Nanoarchaeota archaeon]|nr:hypothetical protein [Nanoarchaeota archaeon]
MSNRKRCDRNGQIAVEHLVLTGLILVALIPLTYYITQNQSKTPYLSDAMETLDTAVEALSNLGSGSTDTRVVRVAKNIVSAEFTNCVSPGVGCNAIKVTYGDGTFDIFYMDYFVDGSLNFLLVPGTHYVTLFNDGGNNEIVFRECGDGIVNGGEQCEPCQNDGDCDSGSCVNRDPLTGWGTCTIAGVSPCSQNCILPGEEFACFCSCSSDNDCGYGVCLDDGACGGCESDADCVGGTVGATYCSGGTCVSCDQDEDGGDHVTGWPHNEYGPHSVNCEQPTDCNDYNNEVNFGGSENTAITCDDEIDNDCDGLIDCDDPDCSGHCGGVATCGDGNLDDGEDCDDGCIGPNNPPGCDATPLNNFDGCNSYCQIESCSLPTDGSTPDGSVLIHKFSNDNSHVSEFNSDPQTGYCIRLSENLTDETANRQCNVANPNTVMYALNPQGNSHIYPPDQDPPGSFAEICYGNLVCASAPAETCASALGPGYECVASFAGSAGSQFNAHVGLCGATGHNYDICCKKP